MTSIDCKKPKPDLSKAKVRKCISKVSGKCLGEFMSEHSGHRVCKPCKDIINRTFTIEPTHLGIRG